MTNVRGLVWSGAAMGGLLAACSSGSLGGPTSSVGDASGDGAASGDDGGIHFEAPATLTLDGLVITPSTATITSLNGASATQAFSVQGHATDGSLVTLTSTPTWTGTDPQVGSVAGGTFTASGGKGGVITIHASAGGLTATAKLTVKLAMKTNSAAVDDATATALRTTTTSDATTQWAYPYEDTVWPRGISGPSLMWNGATKIDVYRYDVKSDLFEYEAFDIGTSDALPAGAGRYSLPEDAWTKFVETSSGAATLTVTKAAAGATTLVTQQHWTVAPGSMRGTIYYWSNRQGRVLRIKPGAASPDDFSATTLPATATAGTTTYTCTMTCHSVSADGSTIVSGGDVFGGSYDLGKNAPRFSVGGAPGSTNRIWNTPALTPDGNYLVKNGEGFTGSPNGADGLFKTLDGTHVDATGLDGIKMFHPAFSPDGSHLVWASYDAGMPASKLMSIGFDLASLKATGAPLSLADASTVPSLPVIAYPSGTPDGKWVVYQRATGGGAIAGGSSGSDTYDTRGHCVAGEPMCRYDNRSDLYLASTSGGVEIALAKANGTGYPFALGDRDRQLNFEPTFAPVAAGGYFWVVFTTRRTYGNAQVSELPEVKQLWVAAIEQNPAPGTDPSHAAFRLPGQELQFSNADGSHTNSLNMRGYWALEPCHADAASCTSGSDCCGGFCEKADGAATGTCGSVKPPCAGDGDHCASSADCCAAGADLSCIGHRCSVAAPH